MKGYSMNKQKTTETKKVSNKYWGIILLLVILIISAVGFIIVFQKTQIIKSGNIKITGIVTEVDDGSDVNMADYYPYFVNIKTDFGKEYQIDATTGMPGPHDSDFNCIDVSIVKVGDKVEFNLPKMEASDEQILSRCYPKGESGYYFDKIK